MDLTKQQSEHWLWLGQFGEAEDAWHGAMYPFEGKTYRAVRLARHFSGLEVPEEREIRVTCDQPKCVRPSHTKVGEQRAGLLTMPKMGARQQLEFWRSVSKESSEP